MYVVVFLNCETIKRFSYLTTTTTTMTNNNNEKGKIRIIWLKSH